MTDTKTYYAIGDIHGDLAQLKSIHAIIKQDIETNTVTNFEVIHIGDLVDRRPDSKGTIDYLMNGIENSEPWIVLKGNHDRLFQWFLETPDRVDNFLRSDYNWLHPRMGGQGTLRSYGMTFETLELPDEADMFTMQKQALKVVPPSHIDFIRNLPLYYETDEYFFVHAGVDPTKPLTKQSEDDLLWIRKGWLELETPLEKLIIHGHTPIDEVTHYGHRINIDTGAAWGKELSAIVIDNKLISKLSPKGRLLIEIKK